MMNVAIQQGTPSQLTDTKSIITPFNYRRSPSLSTKFQHDLQQQNISSAKEVYQTVVVPTVFPGQVASNVPIFHQDQHVVKDPKNNNQCLKVNANAFNGRYQLPAVITGAAYQQWASTPSASYSFMQQQLHQFRQQQQQRQATAAMNAPERSYGFRGLGVVLENGSQVAMR